ncbi:MAG: VCBS repeat-containing protein [Verrucomicrobiota bacterium]
MSQPNILFIIVVIISFISSCSRPIDHPWKASTISREDSAPGRLLIADLSQDDSPELLVSWPELGEVSIYSFPAPNQLDKDWPEVRLKNIPRVESFHLWKTKENGKTSTYLIACSGGPEGQVFKIKIPKDPDAFSSATQWTMEALPIPKAHWTTIHSGDFNNDGIVDLVLGSRVINEDLSGTPILLWMSQSSEQGWESFEIGKSGDVITLYTEDVEGDGDLDLWVVDSSNAAGNIGAYWLENPWPENKSPVWRVQSITSSSWKPKGARPVDIDGDKEMDLLATFSASAGSNRILCFKKVTAGGQVAWLPLPFPLSGDQGEILEIALGDVDRDGFKDILTSFEKAEAPLEGLLWFQHSGKSALADWKRYPLSGSSGRTFTALELYDIDKDGDQDVISIESGENQGVVWFENPAEPPKVP